MLNMQETVDQLMSGRERRLHENGRLAVSLCQLTSYRNACG